MSADFLRDKLMVSFLGALSLTAGILLHQHLNPSRGGADISAAVDNLELKGQAAPEIALHDLNGENFVLSDWHGHTVLINFWASWCPPCIKEVPLLIDSQNRWRAQGLRVVGLAIDEIPALQKFNKEFDFNYPVVPTTYRLMEQFGNILGTLPYSVLVDVDGKIAGQYFRPLDRAELDMILSAQLGSAKQPPT